MKGSTRAKGLNEKGGEKQIIQNMEWGEIQGEIKEREKDVAKEKERNEVEKNCVKQGKKQGRDNESE